MENPAALDTHLSLRPDQQVPWRQTANTNVGSEMIRKMTRKKRGVGRVKTIFEQKQLSYLAIYSVKTSNLI